MGFSPKLLLTLSNRNRPSFPDPVQKKKQERALRYSDMFKIKIIRAHFPLIRYTSKGSHVYAIALKWPTSGKLVLGDPIFTADETQVRMLGTENDLKWKHGSKHKSGKRKIEIHVPVIPLSELPCLWAWVFKLSNVRWFDFNAKLKLVSWAIME